MRNFLVAAYGHALDLRFLTNNVVAEGDTVVYQATELATLSMGLHGFPAGSRTRQEQVHIFGFRDGLIVSWKMFPGVHIIETDVDR